jgi:PAS domain S-box-containing protein
MTMGSLDFDLCGYRVIEELYRDAKTVVYRARQPEESRSVIIKLLAAVYPSYQELIDFRHQYTIAKDLDLPGVVRLVSLEADDRGYALVMEDFGGIGLDRYRQDNCLMLVDVLKIAVQLADALDALGRERIVHKDIKPANILINPITQQVKLIDFSIASKLPRETPARLSPNRLAGTLAYLSPEQTGRMNRGIDYRSDFYALGVTLYELLTGKLPFEADDPIDLIHCHLERVAVRIDRVNPDLPAIVAQIVAKLMAKKAEDRYQSALGLKYDLERCLHQFQATGTMAEFDLGVRDLSDRFVIPERLYGREADVATLLAAVDRVAAGRSKLVLVAGCSGIGKTALIDEVHKPITRQHGYFITGKFDQFNRNLPLSGFVQAFRDLIGQLANESDARLASWNSKILAAVGTNGRVLIEVMPELERIIGVQPPVMELAGTAAQQRFNWLFQKAIEVFAQPAHPLTIFLDDLQWADAASLESIESLMAGNGYLLILGAYRDNEVSPVHPLVLTVERLQQARKMVRTISLAPLTFDDTDRLVADTLRCSQSRAQPLTELVNLKTQGNPFFITQFLKALAEDGELRFNPEGYWECDIARVQALALSDDIVEFMAAQLQKLPPATQQLLKLAACIGDRFDLDTLAIVSAQPQLSIADELWQGLQAGLILPTSQIYRFFQPETDRQLESPNPAPTHPLSPSAHTPNSTYRFLHDRVQQAAYALIPASQKQQTHLQIARLLLANTPAPQQSEKLFEIVNHFNMAITSIQAAEHEVLARLNLHAAQKARAANAYAAAANYARIGTEILGTGSWETQYQLCLSLHETLVDAAFLSGDFAVVPGLVQIVCERAQTPIDRVKADETMIHLHAIQKQYPEAMSRGLEILQQLGIKLSPTPDRSTLLRELVKTKIALWGKSNDRLLALPTISDPQKIAKLRILDLLQAPAFFCSQELMTLLSLIGIQLTLRDGNTPWAAGFYATYCIIISSLGELKQAYQIGQLATILAERFANISILARVKVVTAWYAQPWQEPLRTTIPILDESLRMAIDSSNLQYIGINGGVSIASRFYAGIPLDEVVDRLEAIAPLIIQSKDENSQQFFDLMRQTILNLHVPSDRPTEIFNDKDERSLIAKWQASNEAIILSTMYGFKTLLAYHFEDIPNASIYADAQLPYEYAAKGGYAIARIWLFDALTRLAAYPDNQQFQTQLLQRVNRIQRELGKRARLMPENFQHQYDLVKAEKCRVLGDFTQAMELYDRAIAGAKANEYLQEEALATELAAKFYLKWGKAKIAATYMQDAYYCYMRWGAKAKTDDLERRYPQLLNPLRIGSPPSGLNSLATLSTITNFVSPNPISSSGTNEFDLVAAIQTAQALSSKIELPALLEQLCQILLENSGAQICIPILRSHDQTVAANSWQVYDLDFALKLTRTPLAECRHLPLSLIDRVRQQCQTISLDWATLDGSLLADDYLNRHQPQSVMCIPLIVGGASPLENRGELQGIIYLEHRDTAGVFTAQRQIVLEFLASQAAITLHNAQLYEALSQRSAAIEASLDGFAILDRERFIYLNQSHADLFGYTVTELLDRHWHCLYSPDQIQQLETIAFPTVSQLGRWRGQTIATRKDGSTFDEEVTLFLLDNGQLICICRDITAQQNVLRDRQTIELALRESETRYHQLVSNIPAALYQFELTADGVAKMNYLSARFSEMFDIPVAAALADISVLLDRLVPEDRQSFDRSVKKATKLGKSWGWQGRILTPAGNIKWIRGESRPIVTPEGAFVWDGILLDVTEQQAALHERKQAEIALRASEERYQKLADNIPGAIYQFRLASDGSISYPYMSSGCWELFQLTPAAVMADSNCLLQLLHPDDVLKLQRAISESARQLTPKLWEGRAVLSTGELKWIKSASRPELQPDGSIVWDGVMLDVTDRKIAEIALLVTNQDLERATRLKDEFLATMSHELRTPLNAILGMSESLQEEVFGTLNSGQNQAIATIEQSGEHLLSLINDILDVSKMSAGKLELNLTKVALTELCKSSSILVKQQALDKQIQIETQLSVNPDWILVDERRMRQVLINLLNNAVKFTPPGGRVTLAVRVEAATACDLAEGACLCFSVSDTGIGISSADRSKLFQPFIQIDSSLNRKYQGTGLGLVLVKQIVELHGGTVTIDSEVGKGSCFSVLLPQTCWQFEPTEIVNTYAVAPDEIVVPLRTAPTILLAEGNEVIIDTFANYLTAKGYRVILAQTGPAAIDLAQTQHPDLILMDVQLPDLDGITAIDYFRYQSQLPQIPIIALTAAIVAGEREKYLTLGAAAYLTKPVKLLELHHTIQDCLNLN